jgi:PAS domain S-box-containing protein
VVKNSGIFVLDAAIKMALRLFKAKLEGKEKEKALRASEERFMHLFERAPLGYQSLDEKGRFVEVNSAWLETFGYQREEIIGQWFGNFLTQESAPVFKKNFARFKSEGKVHSELEMQDKKGARRFIAFDGRVGRNTDGSFDKTHCILKDITELKQAETTLKEQEEELAAIYENAPLLLMLVDRDRKVRKINGYGASFAGKKDDEIIGFRGGEALGCLYSLDSPDGCGFGPHCGDCKIRSTVLDTFETGNSHHQVEAKLPFRIEGQNTELVFLVSTVKLHVRRQEMALVSIEDITQRKQAEGKIREQEQLFETMFNTITDAVVITNTKREIVLANKGVQSTFGYLPQEVIGKSTEIFYADHENFVNSGKKVFNENAPGNDKMYMIKYRDKFNKSFPGETFGAKLFDNEGKWIGNLGIMRNISERVQYIEELKTARVKAEESNLLKTAFLQNISHEIRTPMNGILFFSEMLKKDSISKQKRDYYTDIVIRSTNQLLSAVTNIITISSIETGQEKVNTGRVNLNKLINDLFLDFQPQARDKNLKLREKKGLDDHQAVILTDGHKITQILTHLISNALKFTHQGSIEFGYALKENALKFFVKDTGIGIKKSLHKKIFEPFRQGDLALSSGYEGAGVGVSIARGLVELLGGEIRVESEPGKGSEFYFKIPYNTAQNSGEKIVSQKVGTQNLFTILVAEDETISYLLLQEILNDDGIKIIHARTGIEAVDMCETNEEIDLVLMDIKMPGMDGYTAAEKLKKLRPDLPVIAQTAYALKHEVTKYTDIFDGYICKPIDTEELKSKIKDYRERT